MPRLDELLARNLGCGRGRARDLLAEGTVRDAGGVVLADGRAQIPEARLPIAVTMAVGDTPILLHDRFDLVLNKPAGCVTALQDDRHTTAYAFVRSAPLAHELRPVGRLDLDTTGLLLWTTDGQWLHRLTHPRQAVPRTYQAALARPFAPPPPELILADGHRPHIERVQVVERAAAHPALIAPPDTAVFAEITVVGGAYHEVRRIFAALGSHVLGLCRVGFGTLALPRDLELGTWRPVEPTEVWRR